MIGECLECGAELFPEWAKVHFDVEHEVVLFEHGALECHAPEPAD